ncbi:hypothetical protein KUCAC02_014199, partial [Chaenocephalus aceratus]
MARHDARNWHDCSKMIGLLCLVASIVLQHGLILQQPSEVVFSPSAVRLTDAQRLHCSQLELRDPPPPSPQAVPPPNPDDSLSPLSPFITSAHCELASFLSPHPPHHPTVQSPPPLTSLFLFLSEPVAEAAKGNCRDH